MNCPDCGTKLIEVLATRKATDGILRYRQCFNGHKFTTKETVIRKPDDEKRIKRNPELDVVRLVQVGAWVSICGGDKH